MEKQETPVQNFSKLKKPNKYCLGNQTKLSIFFEKQSWLYGCRSIQSKKYKKKIPRFNKKISTKLAFLPQQKNWHNRTTVLYTKYVRTKNYIPLEKKN